MEEILAVGYENREQILVQWMSDECEAQANLDSPGCIQLAGKGFTRLSCLFYCFDKGHSKVEDRKADAQAADDVKLWVELLSQTRGPNQSQISQHSLGFAICWISHVQVDILTVFTHPPEILSGNPPEILSVNPPETLSGKPTGNLVRETHRKSFDRENGLSQSEES